MLTATLLKRFAPSARADLAAAIVDGWPRMYAAGLTTPLRLQHFMAQTAHETGGYAVIAENLNYSAERLTQVWPSRFPTIASATPYARNPEALANKVYGGRLGNTQPSDGWRYRGGGLIQNTGRANYKAAGFEDNPDALRTPASALDAALSFWKHHDCNALADRDDVTSLTKVINGGTTGLADRKAWLAKAKATFMTIQEPPAPVIAAAADPAPVAPKPPDPSAPLVTTKPATPPQGGISLPAAPIGAPKPLGAWERFAAALTSLSKGQ